MSESLHFRMDLAGAFMCRQALFEAPMKPRVHILLHILHSAAGVVVTPKLPQSQSFQRTAGRSLRWPLDRWHIRPSDPRATLHIAETNIRRTSFFRHLLIGTPRTSPMDPFFPNACRAQSHSAHGLDCRVEAGLGKGPNGPTTVPPDCPVGHRSNSDHEK